MLAIIGAIWCVLGFVGWVMSVHDMDQSWLKAIGSKRPSDIGDFVMIYPCVLLGPLAIILSLAYAAKTERK